jgi:hypothetical protein
LLDDALATNALTARCLLGLKSRFFKTS